MAIFAKKEEMGQLPTDSPVDLVLQMRQQGYTNNQIVQVLQREGYKSPQIFDAMNQADLKANIPGPQPQPEYSAPEPQPAPMQPQMSSDIGIDKERIEEIAEAIIEEKWRDLVKDVQRIVEWKDKTETRMTKIETEFTNLKESFTNLHQGILGRIAEYDKGLADIGTEIKALEKVFQKILPTLTENVNELSRITQDMKRVQKK